MEDKLSWKLDFIRTHIEAHSKLTENDKIKLFDCLDSLGKYVEIFLYHAFFVKNELDKHFGEKVSQSAKFSFMIKTPTNASAYRETQIAILGNFIAAIHSSRNLYDIFSHLINRLVLNERALEEEDCNIERVAKILPPSQLKSVVSDFLKSDSYRYVAAFSNFSKHNSLIPIKYSLNVPTDEFRAVVRAFEHKRNKFGETSLQDALDRVLHVKNQIVLCGLELDSAIKGNELQCS